MGSIVGYQVPSLTSEGGYCRFAANHFPIARFDTEHSPCCRFSGLGIVQDGRPLFEELDELLLDDEYRDDDNYDYDEMGRRRGRGIDEFGGGRSKWDRVLIKAIHRWVSGFGSRV